MGKTSANHYSHFQFLLHRVSAANSSQDKFSKSFKNYGGGKVRDFAH